MAEGEEQADRHPPLPVGDQLSRGVVDGRDVVGVERVPHPEQVGGQDQADPKMSPLIAWCPGITTRKSTERNDVQVQHHTERPPVRLHPPGPNQALDTPRAVTALRRGRIRMVRWTSWTPDGSAGSETV
jgi:hypothetical protein